MKRTRKAMNAIDPGEWVALREDDGRAYLLQKTPGEVKIKGLGRFDSNQLLSYKNNISSQYDINTNLLIRESNYNKAQLFYWSLIFYILSFISATILVMSKFFNSKFKIVPFLLLIIGFLYNTSGLIIRMSILNRPPVSTLYESIIFVAFIAVLLAIILEIIRRDNLSVLIGSLSGIILHYLSFGYAADGDTALVSPPKQPEQLANNLARVLDDEALRTKLAESGFQKI